jgi:hypothetical protein
MKNSIFRLAQIGSYLLVGTLSAAPKASIDSYPLADAIWLGSFAGQVEVNPKTEIVASRPGEIQWKGSDGEALPAGAVAAITSAVQIRQSAEQLALNETNLTIQLRAAEWSHREKHAAMARQLEDRRNQLSNLELSPQELDIIGNELSKRVTIEKEKISEELKELQKRMDPALLDEELRIAQDQLRLDLEKLRSEHQEFIHANEIITPHAAVLHIEKTGYVRANEVIGTFEDSGRASLSLQIADPEILREKPEALRVMVDDSRGNRYLGDFSHLEQAGAVRMGTTLYHFILQPQEGQEIPADMTGERLVTLSRKLPVEARILPKTDFLFESAAEIQKVGWQSFISDRWPGAEILFVGPRSLAVIARE